MSLERVLKSMSVLSGIGLDKMSSMQANLVYSFAISR